MRPFDEIPFEESDYSDVALLVASVREWPSEDFTRELDARVARRFESETPRPASRRSRLGGSGRIAAGPAVALVAGAVAAVVVLSSGGTGVNNGVTTPLKPLHASDNSNAGGRARRRDEADSAHRLLTRGHHDGDVRGSLRPQMGLPVSERRSPKSSRQPRARAPLPLRLSPPAASRSARPRSA